MSSDHSKPTDDVAAGHAAATAEGEAILPAEEDADEATLPEPEEETLEPPPPRVAELCAACVRFVATRYNVMLDFTPDTLSLLDQYVRDARAELAANAGSSPSANALGGAIDLVQSAAGAYLGETMRQVFGGTWFAEGEEGGWRLDFSRVYLTFNPIGMAREALLLEPQEGWHAHLETDPGEREELEQRLAALPQVDEEEYYAPTTRFDVVHIAYDALRAKMQASGLADVRFGPEDYKR